MNSNTAFGLFRTSLAAIRLRTETMLVSVLFIAFIATFCVAN